ncbi:MAG: M55 family metallopeptidase [Armatimonadetes bacterium]|nr:M55 family metallopeptidase [Armatimonadota bacterium]
MKILIVTDLEGVAGVLNSSDWCLPAAGSRYYEDAKELLTLEVNAAVDGFLAGGATDILVSDGHGPGGMNPKLLHKEAKLKRGSTGYGTLGDLYDVMAWVGQHAKAGTEYAHLCHTQGMPLIDVSINGISVGEFGQSALCGCELGKRAIFGSGDAAFCKEAEALFPGIETVTVKWGIRPGKGDECTPDQYRARNAGAIHLSPAKSRDLIREGAERAIRRAKEEDFGLIKLSPPFERAVIWRQGTEFKKGEPWPCKAVTRDTHPTSVIALMNMTMTRDPQPYIEEAE